MKPQAPSLRQDSPPIATSVAVPAVPGIQPVAAVEPIHRRKVRLFYLVSLPLWLAVLIRTVEEAEGEVWIPLALIAMSAMLFVTERSLSNHYQSYPGFYFSAQVVIIFTLMMDQPDLDFFPILFIPLCAQITMAFTKPRRYWWIAVLIMAMATGLLLTQDLSRSLALILLYIGGYLFVASYASVTEQAEAAEAQSRSLVADLQKANEQLRSSAVQIEELAVVEERNRLARDLHDSVSQTLYGLALSAEAARRRFERGNDASLAAELESMSETARGVLTEMRLLIYELRPVFFQAGGLAKSLENRLNSVERRAGLDTVLTFRLQDRLPPRTETELDRIAIEALNNVIRHANAGKVEVSVHQAGGDVVLEVIDDGQGFDPAEINTGGLGLHGLRERAQRIGGVLTIDSARGSGTTIRVMAPL